jgi:hypothetical protein
MTITADQRTAMERFAHSFVELAVSLGLQIPDATAAKPARKPNGASRNKKFAPIDSTTPPAVREERQRLILAEIDAAGGEVAREEWIDIAARYGYDPRRLGGFFTKNGGVGMLKMAPDRKTVQLTGHGKARL